MLAQMSIEKFLGVLASNEPAPGGGSVAALSGALGAALVSMVCQLSIGRKGLENFEGILKRGLEEATKLRTDLLSRVDLDTQAFNAVMAAFKMPKETDEQKAARSHSIQQGYKEAVKSPLAIAEQCVSVLRLTGSLLGKTNANALSDLGVGAQEAYAGLEGAIMNVKINLPTIKDTKFVNGTSARINELHKEGIRLRNEVERFFHEKVA